MSLQLLPGDVSVVLGKTSSGPIHRNTALGASIDGHWSTGYSRRMRFTSHARIPVLRAISSPNWTLYRFSQACLVLTLLAGCHRAGEDTNVATESSPSQRGKTVKTGDGHQKMLALLDQIARRASDENFYTGSSSARKLRQQLDTFPPDATPAHRVQILRQLASAELNLGNTRESIDLYSQAYQLLDEKKMPPALVYNVTFRLGGSLSATGGDTELLPAPSSGQLHHPDSRWRSASGT